MQSEDIFFFDPVLPNWRKNFPGFPLTDSPDQVVDKLNILTISRKNLKKDILAGLID